MGKVKFRCISLFCGGLSD